VSARLGIDVGGTFSDLIFVDDRSGRLVVGKRPTTADQPDVAVEALIASLDADDVAEISLFLHASTIGINSLIQRNGARVGLLTTRGFRDVLEIGRGDRDEMYDLLWRPPPPLVRRSLRLEAGERVLHDGTLAQELAADDVRTAAEVFSTAGVDSVAVVFLHSYANPINEEEAGRLLREQGFEGAIALSHRVSGEYREYERTTTTVVDAYIRTQVSSYLDRLETTLRERGVPCSPLMTRSGGGAISFDLARERPVETIISGPVAGAAGALELSKRLRLGDVITADVGGTSFDTCLLVGEALPMKFETRVASLPLQIPCVDVRSIGAGGGSIAHFDVGGLIKVGPESAGSTPGPVCYGRGGTEPTVTDAFAALGILGQEDLAGEIRLDVESARDAITALGERAGLDTESTSAGIIRIATSAMAGAIRSITIERGHDPRDKALVVFGGAGPLFGTLLADELGIDTIAVPAHAGNFSALGLLMQDLVREASQTFIHPLDEHGVERARAVALGLAESAGGTEPSDGESVEVRASVDVRYVGQEYTLNVPAALSGNEPVKVEKLASRFASAHEATFGHAMEAPLEIVSVRVSRKTLLPRPSLTQSIEGARVAGSSAEVYSFATDRSMMFGFCGPSDLDHGQAGPIVILDETSTTYVDAGWSIAKATDRTLLLTRSEARPTA
jgi:N-methylhydantoinase A